MLCELLGKQVESGLSNDISLKSNFKALDANPRIRSLYILSLAVSPLQGRKSINNIVVDLAI